MPLVIWIIDDDLVSQYATRYRIEQSGNKAKVLDFDGAESAYRTYLKKLEENRELPDIIFLDLLMPDTSGWEFLEKLDGISEKPKSPDIYILSAFSNSKDRKRAEQHASVVGHFDKPLSKIDMEKTLSALKSNLS